MLRVLTDDDASAELTASLDEIVREGARRMLAVALEAEVDAYVSAFVDEVDERGRRLVTRNGHAEARTVTTTAAGGIDIEAPRVNDRRIDDETGQRCRFRSVIVPPWCRKSPKVTEVLPLLYLHGRCSESLEYTRGVLRLRRRAERLGHHPPHQAVAGRAASLRRAAPGRA